MTIKLKFSKMHGLGNDFVVIDAVRQTLRLNTAQIKFLADRHFGIGCDQLLLVEKAQNPMCDFRYRIFNADGHEVEQCGNGARCFAQFVYQQGLTTKRQIKVETMAGIIEPQITQEGWIQVDMGKPRFGADEIPYLLENYEQAGVFSNVEQSTYIQGKFNVNDHNQPPLDFFALSMGNPHAVIWVDDLTQTPVGEWGKQMTVYRRFPKQVNVGFVQRQDAHHIALRVFERGVGETLACGTGACAAVVAGIIQGYNESPVTVHLTGGDLKIIWQGEGQSVWMIGPAQTVFSGEIELSDVPVYEHR